MSESRIHSTDLSLLDPSQTHRQTLNCINAITRKPLRSSPLAGHNGGATHDPARDSADPISYWSAKDGHRHDNNVLNSVADRRIGRFHRVGSLDRRDRDLGQRGGREGETRAVSISDSTRKAAPDSD